MKLIALSLRLGTLSVGGNLISLKEQFLIDSWTSVSLLPRQNSHVDKTGKWY